MRFLMFDFGHSPRALCPSLLPLADAAASANTLTACIRCPYTAQHVTTSRHPLVTMDCVGRVTGV
eukprot:3848786-Rhodomonas_salina.3